MTFFKDNGMKWGVLVIGILSLLLFVGGPDAHSHRIYQETWDSGHLVLFAGIVLVLLNTSFLMPRPWWQQFVIITVFCLVLGMAIEILQLVVGRNFELKDLLNDLLGGYIGFALFTVRDNRLAQWARFIAYPVALIFCLIGIRPVLVVIADHFILQEDFPTLADFETSFELSRWDMNLAQLAMEEKTVRYGKRAMRIRFLPGEYPDITLKDFVSDWRDFKSVRFSIYSTEALSVNMELKIYDRQHQLSNYAYSDRFNRSLQLSPGWNDISISLDDVQSAPRNRELNMAEIVSFSLFLERLDKPMTMFFDGLHLSSKSDQ